MVPQPGAEREELRTTPGFLAGNVDTAEKDPICEEGAELGFRVLNVRRLWYIYVMGLYSVASSPRPGSVM